MAQKRKHVKMDVNEWDVWELDADSGNDSFDELEPQESFVACQYVNRVKGMRVDKVKNETCFFALLEECGPGGFYHNRTSLLKGYIEGRLYTVSATQPHGKGGDVKYADPIWAKFNKDIPAKCFSGGEWRSILPCFCLLSKCANTCECLWVHPRIRKQGVATKLLLALKIKHAEKVTPEAKQFWRKYFSRKDTLAITETHNKINCDICHDTYTFDKESGTACFSCLCTYADSGLEPDMYMLDGPPTGYNMTEEQAKEWDEVLTKRLERANPN